MFFVLCAFACRYVTRSINHEIVRLIVVHQHAVNKVEATALTVLSMVHSDSTLFASRTTLPRNTPTSFVNVVKEKMRHVGTTYGGWMMLPQLIQPNSVVFGFGLGKDISVIL